MLAGEKRVNHETVYQSTADIAVAFHAIHRDLTDSIYRSNQVYYEGILEFCDKHRGKMRGILENSDLVRQCSPSLLELAITNRIAGVDSSVQQIHSLFSTLIVGYGISCNHHRSVLSVGGFLHASQSFNNSILVDYFRCYLEAVLLTPISTQNDVSVILDQSFAVVLSTVLKTIQAYYEYTQELVNDNLRIEQDEFGREWLRRLIAGLGEDGYFPLMFENSKVVGVTKSATSKSLVRFLQREMYRQHNTESFLLNRLTDRRLLEFLLEPGEYIVPHPLSLQGYKVYREVDTLFAALPKILRQQFAGVNQLLSYFSKTDTLGKCSSPNQAELTQIFNKLCYTYYRPYRQSYVYRLEFHGSLLFDGQVCTLDGMGAQFQALLERLNVSYSAAFMEPDMQYLADKIAKKAVSPWQELILAQLSQLQIKVFDKITVNNQLTADLRSMFQVFLNRYRT